MNERLDELYLRWLYGQISPEKVKNPKRRYWRFSRQLHQKEFIWFVPNDDNRVADGKDLRDDFLYELDVEAPEDWYNQGCSCLELLIGLSRRLAFLDMKGANEREWFWIMVENMGIRRCDDLFYAEEEDLELEIDDALDTLIWRTYDYSGHYGGLFPLDDPVSDQREMELWGQLSSYLVERSGV